MKKINLYKNLFLIISITSIGIIYNVSENLKVTVAVTLFLMVVATILEKVLEKKR